MYTHLEITFVVVGHQVNVGHCREFVADSVSFQNYSGGLQNRNVSKERGIGRPTCMVLEYFSGVMQMEVSPDPLSKIFCSLAGVQG